MKVFKFASILPSGISILTGAAAGIGIGILAPEAFLKASMAVQRSLTLVELSLILLFIIVTFIYMGSKSVLMPEMASSALILFISSSFIIFYRNKI